ncbi:hypothetical protein PHYSODRAFT_326075 [Phytophthora sojae]|uniref:Uncharacterized protein n=1 Tax=Phytophthora sojae (strain P6497) TaxID=1094619 RepID=G4YX23_PHYSP|nr:hypothetical protein PHYSODRAFT_326075 [Phytophthora sojae]EGZ25030.1 hypothetical protein PHYSODRAFT_326075 [Phytophthora sojae]|eukprot:XP_009520318.1 hypothetical protein PHYSODRAFT_326075 [Phytophthora sojae]
MPIQEVHGFAHVHEASLHPRCQRPNSRTEIAVLPGELVELELQCLFLTFVLLRSSLEVPAVVLDLLFALLGGDLHGLFPAAMSRLAFCSSTTKTPSVTRQRVEDLKQRDQVVTEARGVDGSLDGQPTARMECGYPEW